MFSFFPVLGLFPLPQGHSTSRCGRTLGACRGFRHVPLRSLGQGAMVMKTNSPQEAQEMSDPTATSHKGHRRVRIQDGRVGQPYFAAPRSSTTELSKCCSRRHQLKLLTANLAAREEGHDPRGRAQSVRVRGGGGRRPNARRPGVWGACLFEALDTNLTVHTDADWAGCRSRRKSTSVGVASTNIGVVKH